MEESTKARLLDAHPHQHQWSPDQLEWQLCQPQSLWTNGVVRHLRKDLGKSCYPGKTQNRLFCSSEQTPSLKEQLKSESEFIGVVRHPRSAYYMHRGFYGLFVLCSCL